MGVCELLKGVFVKSTDVGVRRESGGRPMGKLKLVFRVRVHGAGAQNREFGKDRGTADDLSHPEKLKLQGTFLPHGGGGAGDLAPSSGWSP